VIVFLRRHPASRGSQPRLRPFRPTRQEPPGVPLEKRPPRLRSVHEPARASQPCAVRQGASQRHDM